MLLSLQFISYLRIKIKITVKSITFKNVKTIFFRIFAYTIFLYWAFVYIKPWLSYITINEDCGKVKKRKSKCLENARKKKSEFKVS